MFSEVSSEQSPVRKGADYDEVYPSGQNDFGASYLERVSSANSPSKEEEEDSDMDGSESDTNGDLEDEENAENVESPISSVVGPDDLRKFVLPLMWMVNDFNLTIKRKHFNTLLERY